MVDAVQELPSLLKALSDSTRLRILGLLELEELSVGELSRALEMAQSRVSNHLRVLRETGLLAERHVGTSTFLRPAFGTSNGGAALPYASRLWATLREGLEGLPQHEADRMRLRAVLAARGGSDEFFDRLAGDYDKLGALFESGQARQRTVANLLAPGLVLADLGCGTGYMARALTGLAARLICVDRSQGMLEQAERRLTPAPPGTRIEFRQGELDALPIADDEVDCAVAGMVLHHLPEPFAPLREMHRIIRPGGVAAVLELAPHREAWMREGLGDRHLGLEQADVVEAFRRAGFQGVRIESVDDRYCPERPHSGGAGDSRHGPVALPLFIVRGQVPSTPS